MENFRFNLFLKIALALIVYILSTNGTLSQAVDPPTIIFNGKVLQISMVDHDLPVMWGNSIIITRANSSNEGMENTEIVVNHYKNYNNGVYAANICKKLNAHSHDDWYLPSRDELLEMCRNYQDIGNFKNTAYWSSTEDNNGTAAHAVSFPNGYKMLQSKSSMARVRCIRVLEEDANGVVMEKPKVEDQTKDSGQSQSAAAGKNDSQDKNLVSNTHVTETTISYSKEEPDAVKPTPNVDQGNFSTFFEKYDDFDNCQHFIAEMNKWMDIYEHTLNKAKTGDQSAIDELKEYVGEDSPFKMVLDIDFEHYKNNCKNENMFFDKTKNRLKELQNEYKNLIE